MPLDRQSIEKKDFPLGRRGYDPEAVDAHLKALAEEVAELKRSSRQRNDTLASAASEQVRAIVQAAETSAADIQRDAESEAKEIREDASQEAQTTREQATEQAREYLGKVSQTTDAMHSELEGMRTELNSLIETMRATTGKLTGELHGLEDRLEQVRGVVAPRPAFEPESNPGAVAAAPVPEAAVAGNGASATGQDGTGATAGDDAEGARLIALNMALNGTPREETERYLNENFSLSDAGGLLDEVYSSVEG